MTFGIAFGSEHNQRALDCDLQAVLYILPLDGQPLPEGIAELHLVQQGLAPGHRKDFARVFDAPVCQGGFEPGQVALYGHCIDCDPAVRGMEQIGTLRCQCLAEAEQTLPEASARLRLKSAGPEQLADMIALYRSALQKA
ncbi:MAG: hypothetical protein ABJL57_00210 [Hyphomonas sp.]|uniref:hypothetical protein n=1 Tax=Hyphomonas sp. TaxID=87 RepID=UPI0032978EA9